MRSKESLLHQSVHRSGSQPKAVSAWQSAQGSQLKAVSTCQSAQGSQHKAVSTRQSAHGTLYLGKIQTPPP